MILHTLNAAPTSPAFRDCVQLAGARDAVVLLGDAVYAAIDATAHAALCATHARLYILGVHAVAAGISEGSTTDMDILDMDGFVALSEEFPRQQAWY